MAKTAATHVDVRYRATDSAGTWSKPQRFAVADAITVNGLDRGKSYDFQVRGVSACGATSDWANATHVVSPADMQPLAPDSITAAALADGVHLDWTVPAAQGSDIEYEIQRAPDADGVPGAFAKITQVRALGYTDPTTDGVTRWYRVRAVNYAGGTSDFSDDVSSRGKIVPDAEYAFTDIVDNPTFTLPVDSYGNIPGWKPFQGGAISYIVSAHYNNANIMTMQGATANGGAESTRKYACQAGDFISVTADLFTVTTAGSLGRVQVHFYRADGTDFAEGTGNFSAANTSYQTWQTVNAKGSAPANAAYFTIVFYNPTTSGTAWQFHCMNIRMSVNDVRVPGSGATVGNQGNLVPINWNGVRSVLNTSPLTYSINTASPATLTFSCAAVTIRGGSFAVSYNASSGSTTQARNTTQTYYFYYIDPDSQGGSQTLHFTTNIYDLSAQDGIVNIGNCSITVPSSGGGSGTGGGGGGWCVCDDMWVDAEARARNARPGHLFDCCDLPRHGLQIFRRALRSVERHETDCVRLTTDGGAELDCGASTPFDTVDGRQLYAVQMAGELVLTDHGLQRVVSVTRIGMRRVCFFHFGGVSYAAGRDTRPLWIQIVPQWLLPRLLRRRVDRVFSHNTGGTIAKP